MLASGCAFNEPKPHASNSEDILKRIEQGGLPYVRDLVRTGEYDTLLDQIEAGDDVLIAGTPTLAPHVDASTATGPRFSLSRAVKHSPDAVMRLIPDHYAAEQLCTIPYMEESILVELRHVWESLAALQASDKQTAAHVDCIAIYTEAEDAIQQWLSENCEACFPPP